ncbi:MAG TPA: lactate racemase domain-containing protein [Mycobacteriales bacterium]|nr:lactate racemase domain-containing protein [Mycobacteriales bacterium]
MTLRTVGGADGLLDEATARGFVADALGPLPLAGRSLCVIVPDATRTCPLPELLTALRDAVVDRVSRLTVLIALGTHQPLRGAALSNHVGKDIAEDPRVTVVNHEWWEPSALTDLGTIDAAEISAASDGRLAESVVVTVNRHAVEHDVCLVLGPVFPHEVIGFSGGNKYFFPGIAGREIIDLTHWLGALITSGAIIGVPGITPVRRIVNRAAEMVPTERLCLALVVGSGSHDPAFMAFGTPEEAWAAAAEVSAQTHVRYLDRPVRRVLSLVSERYDDLWTAAKGMYKVDPVVADGGEVVLYAPHVTVASETHGQFLARIGYHCRDYFLADPPRFADIPRSVIAHSTHVRGAGTMDPVTGEHCRITVTLATGIDEATTRALNLSYRAPESIDAAEWDADPETMVVPNAGEVLFRLR